MQKCHGDTLSYISGCDIRCHVTSSLSAKTLCDDWTEEEKFFFFLSIQRRKCNYYFTTKMMEMQTCIRNCVPLFSLKC